MPSHRNTNKGYTLVEILIVVTIIVVLGIVLLVGINPIAQIFKSYDARRKADLDAIKIALENYYADHDCYPTFPIKDAMGRPSYVCNSDVLKPYLNSMPCDPNSKKAYTLYLTPSTSTCPQNFAIYAQIYSFFDNQANSIPYCPKTVAASSSNMTQIDIINGCANDEVCIIHYGCINNSCVKISDGDLPPCAPNFCEADCNSLCGNSQKACI